MDPICGWGLGEKGAHPNPSQKQNNNNTELGGMSQANREDLDNVTVFRVRKENLEGKKRGLGDSYRTHPPAILEYTGHRARAAESAQRAKCLFQEGRLENHCGVNHTRLGLREVGSNPL